MATVKFLDAAQKVTGSCHMFEASAFGRILFDCGMHQGGNRVDRKQKETFLFDPHTIDAVIPSHAHLDHSGMLPKLLNDGYNGPNHCADGTADLLQSCYLTQ
jgi:metallo-beta-lactamase family protein